MRVLFWGVVLGLLMALPYSGVAQQFPVLNQNPPNLRWQELSSPHFRLLYPAGSEQPAQRTIRRLEQVYEPVSNSLGVRPRPLTLVLQTQTTISNGFVTILPRHSEFFLTPAQDPFLSGTLDWLDQLAVHEYRHVVQYEKAHQGLSEVAYRLFGYGGLGVATLGVPDWFAEGDAVGTETILTRSGRGRIPNFDIDLRANLLAGRHFSYPKAVAGSFRDNVPNHYVLGYFLSTYAKRRYGPDVWSAVLNKYYRFPAYPFSFSNSLRRNTGLRTEDLYARAMAEVDSIWRRQPQELRPTPATDLVVRPERKVFTQYQYPQYLTDSTLLALKSGLGDISQLVLLSRHQPEQKVYVPGLLNNPEMLSVGGGKVCWPEFRYHVRWGQQVFSELRILNIATGKLTRLASGTRYTAATLSPDGTRLLAVTTNPDYQTQLLVLDAGTGQVLRTLANPEHSFYQHPRWLADGRTAVAVALKPNGKTLELLNTETGQRRELLPVASLNLSHPQPWQDYVLYNSPQSGIDNVYAVHLVTGHTFQVTSRPLGAYHAAVSPDGRHLAFHEFEATGSRVREMPLDTALWQPVPTAAHDPAAYAEPLVQTDAGARTVGPVLPLDSLKLDKTVASSRPYRPLAHAFNIYGWGLVQSPAGSGLSVGVRSQDILNTIQAVAGVGFNQTERTGNAFATLSYQGLFPVLDATIERGQRRESLYTDFEYPLDSLRTDRWNYTSLTVGARLPLQLTQSRFSQGLTLGSYYIGQQVSGYNLPLRRYTEVDNTGLHAIASSASYYRLLRQSKRDVAPRWGQSLLATWRTTPFGTGLRAAQLAGQGSLFLPGIGKHHSLRLRAGYQWQKMRDYRFSAAVFFPRGQDYRSFQNLSTASLEYRLPLADTDWTLGRWLYIQRMKAAAFYDMAEGRTRVHGQDGVTTTDQASYRTIGADVSFVFNPLRLRTPLEAGMRTIYNVRTGEWLLQPLVLDIGF
ncbi:hypothetical protein [Hymenobacter sp. BT730]|uniref:hypothetical protein n=1 Tax=Hymenobacter sp. BT730 TaxID=3063332 RepID=UPI0026DFFC4B|nr:hypothetical protein [Hymenobacter sp. BT730]